MRTQVFGESIRFGVQVSSSRVSFEEYTSNWLACERLGYDIAYVTDHFAFPPTDAGPVSLFESTSMLAAMASRTSRIRCGFMVLGNTFRNPGLLAKTAVTLDHISGGRLELGLGAGNSRFEHEMYAVPYYTPGRRLRMLGESLRLLRGLLTEERTTFTGRYYQLQDAICEPKPLQAHVPFLVGAIGEELGLRVVAESADIWNSYDSPAPEAYRRRLDALERHCRDLGRDPGSIRKSLHIKPLIGESEAEIEQRAPSQPRARSRGLPEGIAAELLAYVNLGVRDFVFMLDKPADMRSLELLATRVAPIVRAEAGDTARQEEPE